MSSPLLISQALASAWQHLHAGQLPQAETIVRRILASQPDQPDALHLLGAIALRAGRADVAVQILGRAISLRPATVELLNDLGNAFVQLKQFGNAIAAFRQGLTLSPAAAGVHYNLGNALRENGQIDEAIEAFRQAIFHRPLYPNALNNLANLLKDKNQFEEAIALFRKTIELAPDMAAAHYNLAQALYDSGQVDEAIVALRHVISISPNHAEAYNNLGVIFEKSGQYEDAFAMLDKARLLRPDQATHHYNIANVFRATGKFQNAVEAYQRALTLQPDYALAHYNLGLTLLLLGDLKNGWREYEWRWAAPDAPPRRSFPWPRWNGEPLSSRRILLHIEQGFGDVIQFVRYVPLIAQAGGKVVLACPAALERLFRDLPGVEKMFTEGRDLPRDIDLECPILSLPGLVGTTLETIPASIPYLHADPESSQRWHSRLAERKGIKVGLAWAGRPDHRADKSRSIPLMKLARLGSIPDVVFVSLQKGAGSEQVCPARETGFDLIDWTSELSDFAETAALIDNLDLVISVDTAVAHLAAAMGKKVWLLLPFVPDWRWLVNRNDSPWYPTIRLFRQPTLGDWQTPIAQVFEASKSLVTTILH